MDELRSRVLGYFKHAGFDLVRVAAADVLTAPRLRALDAFEQGELADMQWMTPDWLARSTDPGAFLDGAKSVIVCALANHTTDPMIPSNDNRTRGRVARYARGRDYHRTFESRLKRVVRDLREVEGARARATVDYGPLLERPLAVAAGLGWSGKSTMLLAPGFGPWVMLGAVATDLELEPDTSIKKTCGSCTRCITACPTGAIATDGHVVDSRLCISYHTIENRGSIPRELRSKFGDWVFGCDACLDSCPVGAARFDSDADFEPGTADDAFPPLEELVQLSEGEFRERFEGRAIRRAGRDGMARNACVVLGNTGGKDDLTVLTAALADESSIVRGHAAWAIGQIAERTAEAASMEVLENRRAIEHDADVVEELDAALAGIRRLAS